MTKLTEARAARDLTQRALATLSGVSVATIARSEKAAPNLRNQFKIATALDMDRADLFPSASDFAHAKSGDAAKTEEVSSESATTPRHDRAPSSVDAAEATA